MKCLITIGLSRLANTPDGLFTEELMVKSNEWTVPEKQLIEEPVIHGKASFAIDYSVPSFMRIPLFDAYKLEPRTSLYPFGNQEVGYKPFIT
eukprot:7517039-Heterocapsa_arctica.AAC.1